MECSVSLSITCIFVPFLFWTFWIFYNDLVFPRVRFFMNGFREEPLRRPCSILIFLFSRSWLLRKMQIGLRRNAPRKMSGSSLNLNYFVLILRWMCIAVGTSSPPCLRIHLVTNHLKHKNKLPDAEETADCEKGSDKDSFLLIAIRRHWRWWGEVEGRALWSINAGLRTRVCKLTISNCTLSDWQLGLCRNRGGRTFLKLQLKL